MTLKPLRLAIIASLFSATGGTAVAQTTQADDDMERVVVTATRTESRWLDTPASIERVDVSDQLPGMRIDAAELLAGIPGIQVDTRYNFAQDTRIILRGFGARAAFGVRGVLMRLDGIPLSMPDGQAQTSSIFVDEPARAEVLRGPVAALYGNAAGGVIDLQSQTPQYSSIAVGHSMGANSRQRSTLDAQYAEGPLAASLHYARFRTDGDRAQAEVERDQYAGRLAYQFDNGIEVIARLDDNHAPLLQDPGSLSPEMWREDPQQTFGGAAVFDTRKRIRHQQQSLTVRQQNPQHDWQIAAWNGTREVEQYLPFPGDDITSSGAVIDLTRDFYGVHGQYNWRPAAYHGDWQISVGTDIERQKDTRLGFVNEQGSAGDLRRDETGRVDKNDVYVINTLALHPQVSWLLGARVSDITFDVDDRYIVEGVIPDDSGRTNYSEYAWSTGLNYQLHPNWALFASVGEGFETPTLTELAYQNEGTGLNPDLSPAAIEQYEIGVKWAGAQGHAQLSLFDVTSRDEIVVDQSIDGRTTYRNAGRTERQGMELSYVYSWHPAWSVRSSATLMSARYQGDGFEGQRIPGVANTNAFAQLNFLPWQDNRLRASVAAHYRSRIATSDANDEYAPSYTLWQAGITAQQVEQDWLFSQWLRIDNLLDKNYVGSVVVNQGSGRSFEPAPGRQLSAGVRVERRF